MKHFFTVLWFWPFVGVYKAGIYYDNTNPNGISVSIAGRVEKVYQIFEQL